MQSPQSGNAGGLVPPGGSEQPPFLHPEPEALQQHLDLGLPEKGQGEEGVVTLTSRILDNSVNTWHQGFLDKLYGSTDPVGVASELLLAVLNTNVCLMWHP